MHITETPKCTVGILDTPIQKLERLSQQLGIQLYIKRDDLNGLAFGGNKLRKLDYFLYEAQQQGATRIITYGSNQSNHGRLTAAAAAKFGMKCAILMDEMPPEQATGSLLIEIGGHGNNLNEALYAGYLAAQGLVDALLGG